MDPPPSRALVLPVPVETDCAVPLVAPLVRVVAIEIFPNRDVAPKKGRGDRPPIRRLNPAHVTKTAFDHTRAPRLLAMLSVHRK